MTKLIWKIYFRQGNPRQISGYQNKLLTAITEMLPDIKIPSKKTILAHTQE